MNQTHRPVLLAEAVTALLESPLLQTESPEKSILIDGTFGRGIVKTGLPLHERLVVELSPHEPGKVFIRNGAI